MEIDIYDFDKTLFPYDSGSLFTAYCMLRYPWCMVMLPIMAVSMILMLIGVINFTTFKKTCFLFVQMIPKKKAVKKFWDKYEGKMHDWCNDKKRFSVVISASPDFLLEEIDRRVGFDKLICTRHDEKTGAIIGRNCRNEEKVTRLFQEFDKDSTKIIDVYSDSYKHDKYIFSLANGQCYHIENGERIPFDYKEKYGE